MKSFSIIASVALLLGSVVAQEGATVPNGGASAGASTYSCDPNTCKIENNCRCASTSAPGGLSPADTPQVKYKIKKKNINSIQLLNNTIFSL